jgi:predicted  nucleic acid-binding Zn-ribbon protein
MVLKLLSCNLRAPALQIQLERRKVLMLQQQLDQLTNKLGTTRSAMGSIFSAKEKTQALQKQIKILENRLEKQYIKYNEVRQSACMPAAAGTFLCRRVCWACPDAACAHSMYTC